MSTTTSISFSNSFMNETQIIKPVSKLDLPSFFNLNPTTSKGRKDFRNKYKSRDHVDNIDFYEEVDERMSRNSFEYPEEQAKHVAIDKWLNDNHQQTTTPQHNSFNEEFITTSYSDDLGNVIGIRGYPKSINVVDGDREKRALYNKLKFSYSKLESDYEKLRNKFSDTIHESKKVLKHKDNTIEALKRALKDKRNKSSNLQQSELATSQQQQQQQQLVAQLKEEIFNLKEQLSKSHPIEIDTINNKRQSTGRSNNDDRDELLAEIERLKIQVRNMSLEPNNKLLLELKNENSKLKDLLDLDSNECQTLKENYFLLENQLKLLLDEEKSLENEKNEDVSKLLIELCRYQVQQPKLEMMLRTEREVKIEYQNRIKLLEKEKKILFDNNEKLTKDLNSERIKLNSNDSIELNRITKELINCQNKYQKLKLEKNQLEETLNSTRFKLNYQNDKKLDEFNELNSNCNQKINNLMLEIKSIQENENKYLIQINNLENSLKESKSNEQKLLNELLDSNRKLELKTNKSLIVDENIVKQKEKLFKYEDENIKLINKLDLVELNNRQLKDELNNLKILHNKQKLQLEHYKQTFKNQQDALESVKASKDKELSKLRLNLNFEQYNRQVALKEMEKQLRVSLKELELMKRRFSGTRLICQNNNINNNCDIRTNQSTTTTSSSSIAGSKNRTRDVVVVDYNNNNNNDDINNIDQENMRKKNTIEARRRDQQVSPAASARLISKPVRSCCCGTG